MNGKNMMDCHRNNEIYYFENKRNFLDVFNPNIKVSAVTFSESLFFNKRIREF